MRREPARRPLLQDLEVTGRVGCACFGGQARQIRHKVAAKARKGLDASLFSATGRERIARVAALESKTNCAQMKCGRQALPTASESRPRLLRWLDLGAPQTDGSSAPGLPSSGARWHRP